MHQKLLLSAKEIKIILQRLACQLVENHKHFENSVLIGIQPRGSLLCERLHQILIEDYQLQNIKAGKLDITFYRDDFRRGDKVLKANETEIDFIIENKRVILVDDVLYTGRSIRSALTALQSFGRPSEVELLTLIDRRFSRHLPIQPDYKGRQVDAINDEYVKVNWQNKDGEDAIYLLNN
ncbi:bifunctional pyr operon transcriptional regulator/uracil phosphoribosyltransferase PyrR [Psychroflexus aestuariivivens]|uniref:bifunctional pyr operon transcriptional regulator/uracil phosphoribosyltransferase PyrR n=1 Tax=Psychroflexus aestuariivivens TaxID=1795040 RepID=UPI000FD9BC42|nr:bifunctional pyr operon transcriptional regulator/uracil phosphoribosyltransferase PyrR [Psychroflexus aestuariivivens]